MSKRPEEKISYLDEDNLASIPGGDQKPLKGNFCAIKCGDTIIFLTPKDVDELFLEANKISHKADLRQLENPNCSDSWTTALSKRAFLGLAVGASALDRIVTE